MCENCVLILEEKNDGASSYVRYLKKKKSERNDILIDKPKRAKPKTVCIPENIAAVAKSVREEPSTSIQRRS